MTPQVTRRNSGFTVSKKNEHLSMRRLLLQLSLGALLSLSPTGKVLAHDPQASAEWTILIYGAVDNDWEEPFMRDVRAMREVSNMWVCEMCTT